MINLSYTCDCCNRPTVSVQADEVKDTDEGKYYQVVCGICMCSSIVVVPPPPVITHTWLKTLGLELKKFNLN